VGIVTEYSESDHQAIVDILSAFIQREGRRAGELMIDESHRRNMAVVAEEKFLDKMEALTKRAASKENYLMQQLGVYSKYNVHMCTCSHAHMLTCSLVHYSLVHLRCSCRPPRSDYPSLYVYGTGG
jgi:predicted unusual protein kinase regulating ubiquinone biosynthesis (AarF/ABC1/UbiB family)